MEIKFKDGSFMEIAKSPDEDDKLIFVLCGFKSHNISTMSFSKLNIEEVEKIKEFLDNWLIEYKKD